MKNMTIIITFASVGAKVFDRFRRLFWVKFNVDVAKSRVNNCGVGDPLFFRLIVDGGDHILFPRFFIENVPFVFGRTERKKIKNCIYYSFNILFVRYQRNAALREILRIPINL